MSATLFQIQAIEGLPFLLWPQNCCLLSGFNFTNMLGVISIGGMYMLRNLTPTAVLANTENVLGTKIFLNKILRYLPPYLLIRQPTLQTPEWHMSSACPPC